MLCIVAGAGHWRRSSPSLCSASSPARVTGAAPPHRFALHRRRRGSLAPLLPIALLCIVAGAGHWRRSSPSLCSASSPARVTGAAPPHRFALHRRRRGSLAPLLPIALLCIVAGAGHWRRSSPSLCSASSPARVNRRCPVTCHREPRAAVTS
ncbi:hypothetical protein C3R28_14975 [Mycobacterium tuberculosis]|nr:hypothetical protein C3R28_14975 [Mycobacterium tuberculosis]TKR31962.1 hypothetical protein FDK48_12055 [Mycobacterium tuberculosis]